MEPVYRNIEFCRNAETSWGKLREGRWDWLGVHPDGQFVLGSPRRSGVLSMHAAASLVKEGAEPEVHGVRVFTEPQHPDSASADWVSDRDQARETFEQRVSELRAREGPLLAKAELVQDGRVAEREFVVIAPPTYGTWRPPS